MADSRLLNADCNDMKRFLFIMAAVALAVLGGCEEKPLDTPTEAVLNIPFSSKTLEASKGTFVLNVESNVEWSISSSAEWLTTNASDFSGSAGVLCSYTANTTTKSRTAKLTITPREVGVASAHSLIVTQSGSGNSGGNDDGGNDDGGNDDGGNDDGGNDDGGNDDGGNDDGGNDGGGNGGANTGYRSGWAELPAIVDANGDGIHDNNNNLYYASHLCDGGEKNAQENGKARNYTVCFSAEHHVPMWVAAPRHDCYEGSTKRTDAYKKDPSIPSNIQYDNKSTGGGCNKGHMLGSAERTSSRSTNEQVFYYSNIAPQLSSGYNTGGGGWNTLEDWVDGQVCRDTLYQVIGCYFDRYTDGYGYTVSPKKISFGGRSDVSMPTMFYCVLLRTKSGSSSKSVINCSASELKCAAFVRSHTNDLKGQKVTRSEMMSVADLEKLTGFTFFVNVPNAPKDTYNPSDWGL